MPISPVLSKLLDLLPSDRPASGTVPATTDDGPTGVGPPGPDLADILPPGIAQKVADRGPDALPPGIARQLADFNPSPPPAPSMPATPASPMSTALPSSPSMPATGALPTAPMSADPVGQIISQIAQQSTRSQGAVPGTIPMESGLTERLPPGLAGRMLAAGAQGAATPVTMPAATQPQQALPAQTTPGTGTLPNANAAQPARTAGNALPTAVPPPPATANPVSARPADALPAPQGRPEAGLAARGEQQMALDRASALMGRPAGAALAGVALAPAAAQAAQVMAQTTAQAVPLSQVPVDARGVTLPARDGAMGVRPETVLASPIYTADGPLRRRPRRLGEALPAQLTRWLWLMGLSGNPAAMRDPDPEKDGWFALQWLYWLLAIVAYGCLALALIAMLPSGADMLDGRGTGFSRTTLGLGVLAAAGAWWLARRITRR